MILELLRESGLESIGRFYSLYRGQVIDNKDPDNLNRLLISVPEIMTDNRWAFPRGQFGGTGHGSKNLTPNPGDVVYVEFEGGDPYYPIWSYHGWGETERPLKLNGGNKCGIVTPRGNVIILDEDNNSFELILEPGDNEQTLKIDGQGVTLNTPKTINIGSRDNVINIMAKGNTNINGENIILNGGEIGTTKTDSLVSQLNTIQNDINRLKEALTNAPNLAVPQDGGRTALTSLLPWASMQITPTTLRDLEHETIKQ